MCGRKERVSTGGIRHTCATLVENGDAVLVWTFCGKVASLAKSTDDFSSTGGLCELLTNLLFL